MAADCAQSGKLDTVQKDPPIPAASIPMMFDGDSAVSWVGAHSESTTPRAARTAENARMASRSVRAPKPALIAEAALRLVDEPALTSGIRGVRDELSELGGTERIVREVEKLLDARPENH